MDKSIEYLTAFVDTDSYRELLLGTINEEERWLVKQEIGFQKFCEKIVRSWEESKPDYTELQPW